MCFVMGGATKYRDNNKVNQEYQTKASLMIETYLKHTPHTIHLVTNTPTYFELKFEQAVSEGRLIIDPCEDDLQRFDRFDYTTKLYAIERAAMYGTDVVYWIDCDLYTDGWDEKSFQILCNDTRTDLWGTYTLHQINNSYLWKPNDIKVYSTREDRLIFTNRDKLQEQIDQWNNKAHWNDLLADEVNGPWQTRAGSDGKILGETINNTNTKYRQAGVHKYVRAGVGTNQFTRFEKVIQKDTGVILDREWKKMSENAQLYFEGNIYTRTI